jgi:CRP-like cAMP-binding protein
VAVLVPLSEEPPVEAAVIGHEGMVGLPVMLADGRGPHDVLCQMAGEAWRVPAATFLDLLPQCLQLHDLLHRYTLSLMNQIARSSACNRMHDLNERLARWLVLVQDRVLGDEFVLTQEFLSEMLGCASSKHQSGRPDAPARRPDHLCSGGASGFWILAVWRRSSVLTISSQHEQLFDTQVQASR